MSGVAAVLPRRRAMLPLVSVPVSAVSLSRSLAVSVSISVSVAVSVPIVVAVSTAVVIVIGASSFPVARRDHLHFDVCSGRHLGSDGARVSSLGGGSRASGSGVTAIVGGGLDDELWLH